MIAKDYRIFVGAFPSGELAEQIQAVRLGYDPITARITPPHVTLAGTYWRSGPATADNESKTIHRLSELSRQLEPFVLLLGGIRTFPNRRPVVFLNVTITPELHTARSHLLDLLGPDKHDTFTPHLTLAMRLPEIKAQDMIRALKSSPLNTQLFPAQIHELRLMQRGPQDLAWRCIQTIKLE